MPPEEYTRYLKDVFYGEKDANEDEPLLLPKKANGDEYRLEELNSEQHGCHLCFRDDQLLVVEELVNIS